MANFVSPGVYTIEKDVSDYAPSVNPSIVGLVGFASRGPVGTATLLTTPADLIRTFGTPDLVTGGQGIYGALEILQKTNQVYFVRAAVDANAQTASNGIQLASHPYCVAVVNGMYPNWVYKYQVKLYDKNGAQSGETTDFYAYRERYGVDPGDSIMPTTLSGSWTNMDWHNALDAGIGDKFDAESGLISYIASAGSPADGAGSGLIIGKTAGATMTQRSALEITTYIASAESELSYTSGTYLSATPIDPTKLTFVGPLTFITGAVTADPGSLSSIPTQLNIIAGNKGMNTQQNTPSSLAIFGKTGNNHGAGSGTSFLGSGMAGIYQVAAQYPGLGYNYSAIEYQGGIQYRGIKAVLSNTNDLGKFVLDIQSDGATEESFDMRIAKPGSQVSATSIFPEDVLNKGITNVKSMYVKGNFYGLSSDGTATPANQASRDGGWNGTVSGIPAWNNSTYIPTEFGNKLTIPVPIQYMAGAGVASFVADKSFRCVTLESGKYSLWSGVNGDASDYAGSLSNTNVRQALVGTTGEKTGIYALDQEDVPVTLVAVPGVTDQSVQNALVTLAENTQNFLAVISPPLGFRSSQQAIAWSNGKGTGRTASLNTSYAAVYWPWVKAFDAYTGTDRFYDPTIYAIGQMCYTDEVADPWFAPAGLTRGRLTKPTDVEVKLSQGDRDALYGSNNVINPITKFTTDGIVIYGQRTAQRAATALDRVNVRRLMIFLRRLVLQSTRRFVFEPNDPITWEAVRSVLNPALADIQQRRGITSFKVVCDSSTNTPIRVDRNELWCKVIIKPTKAAEMLIFELNLTSQSASV